MNEKPPSADGVGRVSRGKPWYYHVPCVEQAAKAWRRHPVTGLCAVFVLLLGVWGMWSAFEDTIAKRFLDPAAEAKEQAARDATLAGHFGQVRTDMSRVAEDVSDTAIGVSSVGVKVDEVLARIDQDSDATVQLNERLEQLAASGTVLVTLTPEKLAQLRALDQPRLKLYWYDDQHSRVAFDDTAPEFKPGQSLHVQFTDPAGPGAPPTHKYLLVIKGNGKVHLYPDDLVNSPDVRGDWEIDPGYDNESMLVVASPRELTDQDQAELVASLESALPDRSLPIRRNVIYEWRNGEIYQVARAHETRDLKRNPNAPVDWVDDVNRALAEHNVTFHGFTYPVAHEPISP